MKPRAAPRLISVVSGMIVWAVWFVAVYSLTGVGCRAGWNQAGWAGTNLLTLTLVASAILALVLIGWCGRRGHVMWRQARDGGGARGQDAAQRQRFIGMATAVLAGIAAIGTLLTAIPMLMLDPCAI